MVGTHILEGAEQAGCLRSKGITQHMGEPQLQANSTQGVIQSSLHRDQTAAGSLEFGQHVLWKCWWEGPQYIYTVSYSGKKQKGPLCALCSKTTPWLEHSC